MSKGKWTIVPAAPGQTVIAISVFDGEGRPGPDHLMTARYLVCAWRIWYCEDSEESDLPYADPITDDQDASAGCSLYVVLPDGTLNGQSGQGQTVEEAESYELRKAQIAYDNETAAARPAA